MEEELIPFKTAKLAKQKGFDNNIFGYNINQNRWFFNSGNECYLEWDYELESKQDFKEKTQFLTPRPTQSLLQKWLRDKHDSQIQVHFIRKNYWVVLKCTERKEFGNFKTYEKALEKGLYEALKLIK